MSVVAQKDKTWVFQTITHACLNKENFKIDQIRNLNHTQSVLNTTIVHTLTMITATVAKKIATFMETLFFISVKKAKQTYFNSKIPPTPPLTHTYTQPTNKNTECREGKKKIKRTATPLFACEQKTRHAFIMLYFWQNITRVQLLHIHRICHQNPPYFDMVCYSMSTIWRLKLEAYAQNVSCSDFNIFWKVINRWQNEAGMLISYTIF